jgi:dephospho-CoA kinase
LKHKLNGFGGAAVSRWPNKYVIGLTGNIATGKSVVLKMLQHSGAYTIDADQLVHQAMMPGAPAYKPIVDTFGQFIVGSDNRINRQMLGQIVFSNPEALAKLEAITHPIVRQAIDALVKRATQRVVVVEAIKLLDGDLKDWMDTIWVVNATKQTQYKRLVTQRKMSEDEAKKRILAQAPQEAKLKAAKVVIDNDSDVEKTWKQVQAQWDEIKRVLTAGAPKPAAPQAPAKPAATSSAPSASAAPAATPAPAPAAAPLEDVGSLEPAASISVEGMTVVRGMPKNAQQIADFMNANGGKGGTSRMDVMMSFGQKSYLIAQDPNESPLALIGWTVDNLVTRMDDFYFKAGVPVKTAAHAVIVAVEDNSKLLQSEAAFLFLPANTAVDVQEAFKAEGYNPITLKEIKIPIWREAVEEAVRQDTTRTVLWKQLRQDRVLQPI